MNRRLMNGKTTFTVMTAARSEELQAALSKNREDVDNAWDMLDEGWKELENRMVIIGITKPVSSDGCGVVHLNVGGLLLNVRRAVLGSMCQKNANGWTLANLFDAVWDSRVPRDKDGRVVLDESPVILKYLVHTHTKAHYATTHQNVILRGINSPAPLPTDQHSYVIHVARVLRLQTPLLEMQGKGGSTILNAYEFRRLRVDIRNWCPGDPQYLELIYRGSQDGLNSHAFHKSCTDESPYTMTLVKVINGDSGSSSVIGGFSSVSWTPTATNHSVIGDIKGSDWARRAKKGGSYTPDFVPYHKSCSTYSNEDSPGAFIFMVKDGFAPGERNIQPVQWPLPRGSAGHPVIRCGTQLGPDFGSGGYRVAFGPNYHPSCTLLLADNPSITGDKASGFRKLDREMVSEIEVYRVCYTPEDVANCLSDAAKGDRAETDTTGGISSCADTITAKHVNDTCLFGASIADALAEEKVALSNAQAELVLVDKNVGTVACALLGVYGPDIAAGKPDPVVELNVCGTRMTTFLSTLRACPESALAARFDDSKWPSDRKDFGVIDCSPSIFAKILDVLRLKKRDEWSRRTKTTAKTRSRVVVTAADRVPFEACVATYFPGYELFVMNCVEFQGS